MKKEISEYVSTCLTCRKVKAEHQVLSCKLYPLEILEGKSDRITMDFVSGLPFTLSKKNSVLVVMDWLTKSAHILLVNTTYSLEKLVDIYIAEIVHLHGIPFSIVSDRDSRFASRFWNQLQNSLGPKLKFSTTFHPQTNGQSESCVIYFGINWEKYIPLLEVAYNNSYHASLKMSAFKALYGRSYRTPAY